MLVQASQGQSGSAHVVVLGNEKGGSGKSTTALHIAVALLKAGQRVATIDLDCRQKSFTHYIDNRAPGRVVPGSISRSPVHRCIKLGETMHIADNETSEFQQFMDAVTAVERSFDFIVIDTPGTDSYLMRLAHSMADTLVTPINDSFVDFDVLGTVDPATYASPARATTRRWCETHAGIAGTRRRNDRLDRRAQPSVAARLPQQAAHRRRVEDLSLAVGFRDVDGFAERVVYRELFPRGLTALDEMNEATLGARPNSATSPRARR